MTKVRKFKTLILILLSASLYFLFSTIPALAAEVYFEAPAKELGLDKIFEVKVFLNTEGESINAIEGEILFPVDNLEFQQINDGGSFVSLWIKKPSFDKNSVIFSGISPGGYEGKEAYLFSLILKGKETGEVTIDAKNMQLLRNEPPGFLVATRISSLKLEIKEQSLTPEFSLPEDKTPPEIFTPYISKDSNVFDGKWFLVFATQDKISGIDHYEVQENRKQKIENRKWILAESPYLLKDQELKSYIYVKTIDRAGNERTAALPPQNQSAWYEKYFLHIIFGIGIIIIIGGVLIFIKRNSLWRKR